ncbi:Ribonuclease H1 [Lamellibrachia satsuma]|nr:Ribonuclease H1 [Lamellibrachia satsuma]
MPFYAVRKGRKVGIYTTWAECEQQVKGFNQAKFKKFPTEEEAETFMTGADSAGQKRSHDTVKKTDSETAPKRTKKESYPEVDTDAPKEKRDGDTKTASVYTDGCCLFNGKHGACGGIGVYWGPSDDRNVSEPLPGRQTNNRAEIHAARKAIEQAKDQGMEELVINTDSRFLIQSVTEWMSGWKRRNWMLSSGGPVKNKEDFQELDEAMQDIAVKWVHVPGHKGVPGNEAADKLANEGAKKKPKE